MNSKLMTMQHKQIKTYVQKFSFLIAKHIWDLTLQSVEQERRVISTITVNLRRRRRRRRKSEMHLIVSKKKKK